MREFDVVPSHIPEWFLANQLTVNIDKTCVVKFIPTFRSHYHVTVKYAGRKLTEVTDLTFLGWFIDNHLNFKYHNKHTASKVGTLCYAIRYLSYVLDTDYDWFTITVSSSFWSIA
jgi:extradiol dioxygenase family protein